MSNNKNITFESSSENFLRKCEKLIYTSCHVASYTKEDNLAKFKQLLLENEDLINEDDFSYYKSGTCTSNLLISMVRNYAEKDFYEVAINHGLKINRKFYYYDPNKKKININYYILKSYISSSRPEFPMAYGILSSLDKNFSNNIIIKKYYDKQKKEEPFIIKRFSEYFD